MQDTTKLLFTIIISGLAMTYWHTALGANIYFCYFVKTSLVDKFIAEGRNTDKNYAIATLVLLAIALVEIFFYRLIPFWGRVLGLLEPKGPEPRKVSFLEGIIQFILLIGVTVLLILLQVWQWKRFIEFRATGEGAIAAQIAVIAVQGALGLGLLAFALLFPLGIIVVTSLVAWRRTKQPCTTGSNAV